MYFDKIARLFSLSIVMVALVAIFAPTIVMADDAGSCSVAGEKSGYSQASVISPILVSKQTESVPPLTSPAEVPQTSESFLMAEVGSPSSAQQPDLPLMPMGTALTLDALMFVFISLVIVRQLRHS